MEDVAGVTPISVAALDDLSNELLIILGYGRTAGCECAFIKQNINLFYNNNNKF